MSIGCSNMESLLSLLREWSKDAQTHVQKSQVRVRCAHSDEMPTTTHHIWDRYSVCYIQAIRWEGGVEDVNLGERTLRSRRPRLQRSRKRKRKLLLASLWPWHIWSTTLPIFQECNLKSLARLCLCQRYTFTQDFTIQGFLCSLWMANIQKLSTEYEQGLFFFYVS